MRFAPFILLLLICFSPGAEGQHVAVTMRFDTNTITVGGSTTLRVFAQVVPASRPNSERIFSWYLDVQNEIPAVATGVYSNLVKTTSDRDPQTSSNGFNDGAHRRGIYDTFRIDTPISKSGIGVSSPVELFSVPVQATAAGTGRFTVAHGTGVSGLSADFIVAPKGGGDPMIGGVYDAATATLTVLEPATTDCDRPQINVAQSSISPGVKRVTLTFGACSSRNNFVEFADRISPAPNWTALPNAPHNSGSAVDTNSVPVRFYRIRVQ